MHKTQILTAHIVALIILALPVFLFAQTGTPGPGTTGGGGLPNPLGAQNGTIYDFIKHFWVFF